MPVQRILPTYLEEYLKRKNNFGIQLAGGWIFGRTIDYSDIKNINFDRYPVLPPLTSSVIVPPKTAASEWNEWMHNPDNQSMFWEWDDNRLLQVFIGIYPADARLFTRFPSPIPRGNLAKIVISAINANAIGYVDGTEGGSPYGVPTNLTEMLIPKEVQLEFAVFNPTLMPIVPKFNIKIRRFNVKYYDPEKKSELETIKGMWEGRIPWKAWSPGIEPWDYDAKTKCGVNPIRPAGWQL